MPPTPLDLCMVFFWNVIESLNHILGVPTLRSVVFAEACTHIFNDEALKARCADPFCGFFLILHTLFGYCVGVSRSLRTRHI